MSEEIIEESVVEEPVKKARKPRAAKKTTEVITEIPKPVAAEETTVTDEGQTVISGPAKTRAPRKSNTKVDDDGVIGSNAADYALRNAPKPSAPKTKENPSEEKVALWSDRNIRWSEVGSVSKGYNIVTKEAAEKWLKQRGVREATPEEVATYYGK